MTLHIIAQNAIMYTYITAVKIVVIISWTKTFAKKCKKRCKISRKIISRKKNSAITISVVAATISCAKDL